MSLCTGALWIAVFGEGVHRYAAGEVSSFTSDHGLSSQLIRAMVQDRDGSLLVGHEKGLDRLSNGAVVARITVRDAGTGISPAVLETVMEPFVSTKEQGLGMGLAISRSIIETPGGCLHAANNPEAGACFTVTIPMAETGRT
jgi:C4-dicarboxylate-specific signal transduction histidine kinase